MLTLSMFLFGFNDVLRVNEFIPGLVLQFFFCVTEVKLATGSKQSYFDEESTQLREEVSTVISFI